MNYLHIIIFLFLCGWTWDTHEHLIESVYYSLPEMQKHTLNLSALQEGSIAPDKEFKDFRSHSYPRSLNKTLFWLEKSENAMTPQERAYTFGVASHYIIDSYSAPHNIAGERYSDHKKYEQQATYTYLYVPCPSPQHFSLDQATSTGTSWKRWLHTLDETIPQQHVHQSMEHLLLLSSTLFGGCVDYYTHYETYNYFKNISMRSTILLACITAVICLVGISLIKEFVKD